MSKFEKPKFKKRTVNLKLILMRNSLSILSFYRPISSFVLWKKLLKMRFHLILSKILLVRVLLKFLVWVQSPLEHYCAGF